MFSKPEDDWARLMKLSLAGDASAYERLLRALAPVLRAIASRQFNSSGRGSSEAEDVVQETLLAIHLKRHTWDAGQPLGPWVRAIVRHKVIDALRRRGRRDEVPVDDYLEILPAAETRPSSDLQDAEKLLAGLKQRQRDIVRSITVDGSSIREVAARFSMKEGAVRVALHRGLKTLAEMHKQGFE